MCYFSQLCALFILLQVYDHAIIPRIAVSLVMIIFGIVSGALLVGHLGEPIEVMNIANSLFNCLNCSFYSSIMWNKSHQHSGKRNIECIIDFLFMCYKCIYCILCVSSQTFFNFILLRHLQYMYSNYVFRICTHF
jgi:hypothetical protein